MGDGEVGTFIICTTIETQLKLALKLLQKYVSFLGIEVYTYNECIALANLTNDISLFLDNNISYHAGSKVDD